MADQDPRETLRVALREFDNLHLQMVRRTAYDRWCWDSGSESDKDWFEVADEILRDERGITFDMSGNGIPDGLSITAGANATDLVIAAHQVKLREPGNTLEHELFGFENGQVAPGFALKLALVNFIINELNFGSTMGQNGLNVRQMVEQIATGSLHMAEWQIQPMFEKFMAEYEARKKLETDSEMAG